MQVASTQPRTNDVIQPAGWNLAKTGFQQSHRSEHLALELERAAGSPRRFGAAEKLLAEAKQRWRDASPELAKLRKLQAQLEAVTQQIGTAELAQSAATEAVRSALENGSDPGEAEANAAEAGRQLYTLKGRLKTLEEMIPEARRAAETAWCSAWSALLRQVRQQVADELDAARREILALVPAALLDRMASAVGEVQIVESRDVTQGFSRP
jgi:chromosome segregation ATPase